MMKTVKLNKESVSHLRQSIFTAVRGWPRLILLERLGVANGVVVMLGFIVALGLMAWLLLVPIPPGGAEEILPARELELDIATIDQLELWIETQDAEYRRSISTGRVGLFDTRSGL